MPVTHDLSPAAGALLRLMAFMAHAPFPLVALSAAAGELPPPLDAAATDPAALDAAEAELARAGRLESAGPAPVLRAEVAEAVRIELGAERAAWSAAAAVALAAAYPRDPERRDMADIVDVLLPHALAAAAFAEVADTGRGAAGQCLLLAGRTLLARGQPDAARRELERAVALLQSARGPEHPSVALALTYLNGALSALGDRGPMLGNSIRALAILQAVHGPRHAEVVVHVNNVGTLLRAAGRLDEACGYFRRALEGAEEVFGPAHPLTATLHGNLGEALHRLRGPAEARPHLARALAIDEAAYGPSHPSVARDLHRLGRVLGELGQRAQAQALLQRAIGYLQRAAGEDDPRVQSVRAEIRALEG